MAIWRNFILIVVLTPATGQARRNVSDVDVALQVADELERRGTWDAARQQLQAVALQATPGAAEDLRLRICALWQRQGALDVARQCYQTLAAALHGAENIALARYRGAALAVDLGLPDDGRQELTQLVDDLPYTAGARRAFVMARALHRERGGTSQETDFLLGVASRLAWVAEPGGASAREGSTARHLLAEALVEIGRLRLVERHDAAGAWRVLQRAQVVAKGTSWGDDTLIWQARTLRELGRYNEALAMYQTLVDAQQSSWFMGVYYSEYYDDALYEIGQTLEQQGQYRLARAAYGELFKRTPTSRLLDDAAFRLANLSAQAQHDNAPLFNFTRAYPASRHVRTVRSAAAPR